MLKTRFSTRRKFAGISALVLSAALLLGSTFAWNDYRQHKTNEAKSDGIVYKARLVEKYNPKDTENWKVTDPAVTKELSVKNPGPETPDDKMTYGDVFIRLQLKEFMELYPVSYVRTEKRYMVNETGEFYGFDTKAAAEAFIDNELGGEPHEIRQIRMYNTPAGDNGKYYIQTQANDINGIYGDFIVTDIKVDYANPNNMIKSNPPKRASDDQTAKHNDHINSAVDTGEAHDNGECLYTPHTWKNGLYGFEANGTGQETFEDYIKWLFGADVITYDEWQTLYDSKPVEKWVVDTNSSEGWVYWMSPLAPGKSTTNLLEKIDLIRQPGDAFYYALHADMQAVNFAELDNWTKDPAGNKAPTDILTALKTSYVKVSGIRITADKATVKVGDIVNFTATVLGTEGISQEVTWNCEGGASTIDTDGMLTIGAETAGTKLTITATPKADTSVKATQIIEVVA